MTPHEFIAKWKPVQLSERSACQQHFLDLCELLGQPKPAAADPEGAWYTFERGVSKTGGGDGWADVWMRGRFGWEYKGKKKDLAAAYKQLLLYREDLENPPLLVVCDMDRFEIHTNFTGTAKRVYAFNLDQLAEPENLDVLRKLFTDPEALRPGQTSEGLTKQAAELFGQLADGLRVRGVPALDAAHFLMKLMFCMFAEDINLLPNKIFSKVIAGAKTDPKRLGKRLKELFTAMSTGGDYGADEILYFDGGLFADSDVIDLRSNEINTLNVVNGFDWADVEPSIFGTLFERTLDPAKRSQIGAHYTSRADIETLLEPVMMAPLRREWQEVREWCATLLPQMKKEAGGIHDPVRLGPKRPRKISVPKKSRRKTPRQKFQNRIREFLERLAHVTVLDPACGSGNFLYVALHLLLDLEKEVIAYAAKQGIGLLPHVRPTQLAGIELNPYAQQLAQVVIWIGYLQWMRDNGFNPPSHPVLEPIESIRRMDAILDLSDPDHPTEPEWPEAEFIVGNPPFLGGGRIRSELGDDYTECLFKVFGNRIPNFSDLCCYWFEKARHQIETGQANRAGLLATQGIRGGANREVLKNVKKSGDIFWAQSDRDWVLEGAMVHVSMVGMDDGTESERHLDDEQVHEIHSNLTSESDLTSARRLDANLNLCFMGPSPKAPFDINGPLAESIISAPVNPRGCCNSDVVRPVGSAIDLVQRSRGKWTIDFGLMEIDEAASYEAPFEHVRNTVLPVRATRRDDYRGKWWQYARPRHEMRSALLGKGRFIATPGVAKHRIFVWVGPEVLCNQGTLVFGTDADDFFGVVHSRAHEGWARRTGTQLREAESGFRYTPTSCFETFPFPNPTNAQRETIAAAAKELDALRTNWLNPAEWTREEILEFPGSADGPWARYVHDPDERGIGTVRYARLFPKDDDSAKLLKKRTLTNLYNERPTWLDLAHRKLDEAVFAAYGWDAAMSDEDVLAALLKLNLERASSPG